MKEGGIVMDLLDKFGAVVIQADNRISESDKNFCERHQAAYETAISSYKEFAFIWEDMLHKQEELLNTSGAGYLNTARGPAISAKAIHEDIEDMHQAFVENIVRHFNSEYHVTLSSFDIKAALLPKKPDSYRAEQAELDAYKDTVQNLIVKYDDIVDQIILRLDGRSFTEQAFYELVTTCHNAAWNSSRKEAKFERKKDTIRLTGYSCSHDNTYGSSTRWELTESTRKILRGVAHFEANSYTIFPPDLSELLGYHKFYESTILFSDCSKIKQLRVFKSHRVDLKFTSEALAQEFIDTYLGTVC